MAGRYVGTAGGMLLDRTTGKLVTRGAINDGITQASAQSGVGAAQQNYDQRQPFRDAATSALGDKGIDWSTLYDPSTYQQTTPVYGQDGMGRSAFPTQHIDRLAAVKEALRSFDAQSQPILDAQMRGAGQKAAAFGALGSGRLNTSLGDITTNRANARDALENQTISDATNAQVNDQFRQQDFAAGQQRDAYDRQVAANTNRTTLGRQSLMDRLALGGMNTSDRNALIQRITSLGGLGYSNDPSSAYFQQAQIDLQRQRQQQQENAGIGGAIGDVAKFAAPYVLP